MKLKNNSGFGWDEEHRMVIAPDDVWDHIIAVRILRTY
jgi:hypothetical protein